MWDAIQISVLPLKKALTITCASQKARLITGCAQGSSHKPGPTSCTLRLFLLILQLNSGVTLDLDGLASSTTCSIQLLERLKKPG